VATDWAGNGVRGGGQELWQFSGVRGDGLLAIALRVVGRNCNR